jgi:hypothetical protein
MLVLQTSPNVDIDNVGEINCVLSTAQQDVLHATNANSATKPPYFPMGPIQPIQPLSKAEMTIKLVLNFIVQLF